MGLIKVKSQNSRIMTIALMPWWEREKLYTEKDRAAIEKAKRSGCGEIDENWAETDAGRYEVHRIAVNKYHNEEYRAGML